MTLTAAPFARSQKQFEATPCTGRLRSSSVIRLMDIEFGLVAERAHVGFVGKFDGDFGPVDDWFHASPLLNVRTA
jgi:hypothetical protein